MRTFHYNVLNNKTCAKVNLHVKSKVQKKGVIH
jgi:hypothetical protein